MFEYLQNLIAKIIRQGWVRRCIDWHSNDVREHAPTIQAGHAIFIRPALLNIKKVEKTPYHWVEEVQYHTDYLLADAGAVIWVACQLCDVLDI